jgi:hypothetical protein
MQGKARFFGKPIHQIFCRHGSAATWSTAWESVPMREQT